MTKKRILGTTRVGPKYRITIIKKAQEKLEVNVGDVIIFLEQDGEIVIRPASLKKLVE